MDIKYLHNINFCKNCVNFLEWEKDKINCDFELFNESEKKKALLYTPAMFKCEHFENLKNLKKG